MTQFAQNAKQSGHACRTSNYTYSKYVEKNEKQGIVSIECFCEACHGGKEDTCNYWTIAGTVSLGFMTSPVCELHT